MPYCTSCGQELQETPRFCPGCGKEVGQNGLAGTRAPLAGAVAVWAVIGLVGFVVGQLPPPGHHGATNAEMAQLDTEIRRTRTLLTTIADAARQARQDYENVGRSAREASLRATLQQLRNAIALFQAQCGAYPARLDDLMAVTAPPHGTNSRGGRARINPTDYQGPYLTTPDGQLPEDPITGDGEWDYDASTGEVHSKAPGSMPTGYGGVWEGMPYSDL